MKKWIKYIGDPEPCTESAALKWTKFLNGTIEYRRFRPNYDCAVCHAGMDLSPNCEVPEDPALRLCHACALDAVARLKTALRKARQTKRKGKKP